jgi:HAD superfamily 5'-nucleotidase-like hydrolase
MLSLQIAPSTIRNKFVATAFTPHATTLRQQAMKQHTHGISPLFASIDANQSGILSETEDGYSNNEMSDIFTTLTRHESNQNVNDVLDRVEKRIINMKNEIEETNEENPKNESADKVYSNSYVDLGKVSSYICLAWLERVSIVSTYLHFAHFTCKLTYEISAQVDTVGFDYDYTLVTYKKELLHLIYDMALKRLVEDFQYPEEMLDAGMKFDPKFSVRGLAVDRETGWICHLSYTHKVAVAYEGRQQVSRERLMKEYTGKRALKPSERKVRLKPLNDLFSMAECCLIADVVQFFKDRNLPFCPKNAVYDVLGAIGSTHISGDFHRIVASKPEEYFEPSPHLREVLQKLKDSGKRLIFVSNSPFWYVDSGMKYVIGENWREMWDAVIVSAGKPRFYTETSRPFREVNKDTGRLQFKKVSSSCTCPCLYIYQIEIKVLIPRR